MEEVRSATENSGSGYEINDLVNGIGAWGL